MKYVIWGAGKRGKRLLNILGEDKVSAFIDNNCDIHNTKCLGKTVISYTAYKERYSEDAVILSMLEYSEAEVQLLKDCIPYFVLSRQPAECAFIYHSNIFTSLPFSYDKNLPTVFYGINLISANLIDTLKNSASIYVLLPKNASVQECSMLKKLYAQYYCNDIPNDLKEYNLFASCPLEPAMQKENCHVYNIYDFSKQIVSYRNDIIAGLKNAHKGEKCFIVATGPSLRMEDLDALYSVGCFCISMNKIFEAFKSTFWRPSLYLCVDTLCIEEFYEEIKNLDANMKFISDMYPKNNACLPTYHAAPVDIYDEKVPFSKDCSVVAFDAGTITYTCLQFAAYLGFSEIYLLGVDFSYGKAGATGNHFYKTESTANNPFRYELCLNAYTQARQYAQAHNIKIYNATRGGKLEVFERVDFDNVIRNMRGGGTKI